MTGGWKACCQRSHGQWCLQIRVWRIRWDYPVHEKGRGELFYILLVHVCNCIAAQYSLSVRYTSRLLNDFDICHKKRTLNVLIHCCLFSCVCYSKPRPSWNRRAVVPEYWWPKWVKMDTTEALRWSLLVLLISDLTSILDHFSRSVIRILKELCHGSPVHFVLFCQLLALKRYGT